jgi:hypothetical protein
MNSLVWIEFDNNRSIMLGMPKYFTPLFLIFGALQMALWESRRCGAQEEGYSPHQQILEEFGILPTDCPELW